MKVKSEVTQSCPTLSDPMDCSLPGSSVHGIFQARVLDWGATAFSKCRTFEKSFSVAKMLQQVGGNDVKPRLVSKQVFLFERWSAGRGDALRPQEVATQAHVETKQDEEHSKFVFRS